MKVDIMSREALEKLACSPFPERTAVISISDYDDIPVMLKHEPSALLRLAFDDVYTDCISDIPWSEMPQIEKSILEKKYHMISDRQAREIADFVVAQLPRADRLICQCEFGQSRSAAISAAILEYTEKKGLSIFADDLYSPNKLVFRKVYGMLLKTLSE